MEVAESSRLFYKDYVWGNYERTDSRISGSLDETILNRKNGHEMIYVIEEIMNSSGMKEEASRRKLERMIRKELPANVVHQDRIKIWILLNWFNSRF